MFDVEFVFLLKSDESFCADEVFRREQETNLFCSEAECGEVTVSTKIFVLDSNRFAVVV